MHDSGTADMFEPPIARKTDPVTSKMAAVAYTESGKRDSDKRAVFDAVRNSTGKELSRNLKRGGMDWLIAANVTSKRLPDLIAEGKVRKGPKRKCTKTGSVAVTYYVKSDFL